jgi:hypothetical protein
MAGRGANRDTEPGWAAFVTDRPDGFAAAVAMNVRKLRERSTCTRVRPGLAPAGSRPPLVR